MGSIQGIEVDDVQGKCLKLISCEEIFIYRQKIHCICTVTNMETNIQGK